MFSLVPRRQWDIMGGIWILAPASGTQVIEVVDINPQVVTVSIRRGRGRWFCSMIYASPIPARRDALWAHLRSLRFRFLEPWVAMGDFNEICLPAEVVGGISLRPEPCEC